MKPLLFAALLLSSLGVLHSALAAEPLRVFIRSGPKTHGPGAHDHPSFLKDWVPLLNERGAKATGGDDFPTEEQLAKTDVLIIHRDGGGNFTPEQEALMTGFTKRGGGIVVIHAGCVADQPKGSDFFKQLIGGSWRRPITKWLEGPMHLYFTDRENPITKDMSNFAMDDEIYYDMDVHPEARILAGAYTPKPAGLRNEKAAKKAEESTKGGKQVSIYDIQPQVWTWEPGAADTSVRSPITSGKDAETTADKSVRGTYRAFVCIPGHNYVNFARPNFRALLLRGIAWAGKRDNADELCKPDELGDNLRYVEGGPTRPEKAAATLEVHPEFNISLVAAEPLINKVMNVDWDEKGRLWVVETPEYPNGRRELNVEKWKDSGSWTKTKDRDPIDRISWLEDTNGDGVMDKKHVFADKLELCTSFCFYKNGVIASAAPDIWNLQDTDGDGVCDKREKLYTGLGTSDTHAVINNLRWGLDGWVYATHGYSSGRVTSPDGAKDFGTDGSGVVRFKPDGSAFEQYASRNGNTWGLDITWDGQVFFTQPTSGTVLFHVVLPEYVLAKGKIPGTTSYKGMITSQTTYPLMSWPEQAYVQIDYVGQFTAAAGCAIYEGGAWPEKWNYSYFCTEPTLNIVHHQFVEKDGVSYKSHKEKGREETEFIRSKDLWFRPIETRVGPDGALYVVDFYNQAVIHNDTRGPIHGPANAAVRPDRDHYFGRIWKVQHKEAKKLEVPVLDKKNIRAVAEAITKSENAPTKKLAHRLLTEVQMDALHKLLSNIPDSETRDKVWDACFYRAGFGDDEFPGVRSILGPAGFNEKRPGEMSPESVEKRRLAYVAVFEKGPPELIPLRVYKTAFMAGDPALRAAYLKLFSESADPWTKSAIAAAGSVASSSMISDALAAEKPEDLESLVSALVPSALPKDLEVLTAACASATAKSDSLKTIILQGIAQQLTEAPALTPALTEALKKLLANPSTAGAALPLVAKWDKAGVMADVVNTQIASLSATLGNPSAALPDRIGAAKALIGVGDAAARAKVVSTLVGTDSPEALQSEIITALGESGSVNELVEATSRLKSKLLSQAFDAILKRPEATLALLASIQDGKFHPQDLGPGNIARLRTHPNKNVAKQANAMMDKLNPNAKAKNELIAQFTPEVEKPGDAVKGKTIFTAACAVCHKIGDIGKDVAPALVGMGAHGPAELLVHIIDPNREIDPSFWAWNITKKNGETLAGVITSENQASLNLRNQVGDFEVKKSDIKDRENTKRSLMPEGLEALGAENLRDILAFICGGADNKFRVLDLRAAYTADTRAGTFGKADDPMQTVTLHKFGNVTVEGVPFFVMDPEKSSNGANMIALKGGNPKDAAWELPARVEIPTNATAASLHILGGVGAWAWPFGGEKALGKPAMTVHVEYADGDKESIVLKNGEHIADYIGKAEVPLSENAGDFTKRGQLRYLAINLKKKAQLKKLTLETSGSIICPCTVAITAGVEAAPSPLHQTGGHDASSRQDKANRDEGASRTGKAAGSPPRPASGEGTAATPKEGGKGDGPLAPTTPTQWEAGKTKVLIIGGGSSHNFAKFFGDTDVATLKAAGFSVHYTEDRDQAADELVQADVAIISVNRKFFDTARYRKALFDRVSSGKGVIMLHPGTWYGFQEWPEINKEIVGGGARGHDKLGPFSVNVTRRDHAIMIGVPAMFDVQDELYYVNAEADKIPAGTAKIEVLAETSPSQKFGKPHPSVWITDHPKARIVGIALGHDERVHDLPAFKAILTNAAKWVAGK